MTPPTPSPTGTRRALDLAMRAGGAVIAVWGAVLLAAYGAFLTPFRAGVALIPVAVLIAVAGNALLAWFARYVTGSRFLGLLPGIVWVILSLVWASRTTEGDIVLANSWVSTLYLFLGATPVVAVAYRWFVPPPRV